MSSIEVIRRSRPDDIPQLCSLFREAFGQERGPEVWSWKYFSSRPSVGYVCEAAGGIVAHCGGIPVQFRDGSRQYGAYQSVDFMSSPAYAGGLGAGGIFVRTVRRMFEECCGPDKTPLVYGFPGERHRLVGERLLGYEPLEPVTEMTLPPAVSSSTPEPLAFRHLRLFTKPDFSFGAIRNESYLAWRYLEHPLYRYGVVNVRRAWRIRSEAAALVREVDDHFLLMELAVTERSAARLTDALSRLGKPVQGWTSPSHRLGLLLARHGFEGAPRDHWVEYRFFTDRPRLERGELYYTLGDYDVH